jgi:hypothetical protein
MNDVEKALIGLKVAYKPPLEQALTEFATAP